MDALGLLSSCLTPSSVITMFDIFGNLRLKSGIESVFLLEIFLGVLHLTTLPFQQSDSAEGPLSFISGGRAWLSLCWDRINSQKSLEFEFISPIMLLRAV